MAGKDFGELRIGSFWILMVIMSMLEKIEEQVKRLSVAEQQALRDFLDNILEDELEFTDEFKEKIERAKRDIAEGRGRVVKP